MPTPIRILAVEDDPSDFELIVSSLGQKGFQARCERVASLADLRRALADHSWDLVLSDYQVPQLDFLQTLDCVRRQRDDLPLILVSGSIGEEQAVELLRRGVSDFVLKDNLVRLVPAIERSLRDTTERRERRHAEAAVAASENRYRRLFETSADGLLMVDADSGRVDDVNPALSRLLGEPRESLLGRHVGDVPSLATVFGDPDAFAAIRDRGTVHLDYVALSLPSARAIVVEFVSTAFTVDGRRVLQCSVRDITQRRAHEREIARLSRLYATLSQISQCVGRVQSRGELFDAVCQITLEAGGFLGAWVGEKDPDTLRIHPVAQRGDRSGILKTLRVSAAGNRENLGPIGTCVREGRPCVCNDVASVPSTLAWRAAALGAGIRSAAGMPITFQGDTWGALAVYDAEPQAFGEPEVGLLQEAARTISYAMENLAKEELRLAAEAALRESEERYRLLAENSEDFVVLTDATGTLFYVSPSFYRVSGWQPSDLGNSIDLALFHPDDRELIRRAVETNLAGRPCRIEYRLRCRDGSWLWLDTRGKPILDAAGKVRQLQLWSRDITQRKRIEQEHLRLVTAIEQAAEVVVITDLHGAIVYVNPAFTAVTGYTREEAIGLNPRILKSGRHEPGYYAAMWQTLATGAVWRGHLVNRRKDGTFFEEEATISPVRDDGGRIVHFVAVKRNVTREVQLEAQVRQAQKTEAIGQLAGGVAHDFNNILATILMQTELELGSETLPAETRDSLLEIKSAADRGASLTRQLLLFSRRQVMQPKTLDLNDAVQNLTKMLHRILGEDINLLLALRNDPLWVHADPGMIDQILVNLAVNARDAMSGGGRLVVETSETVVAPNDEPPSPDALPGRYATLAVRDTGSGILPEHLPRIFDPFFTTKEVGHGTGLGLATVLGIVKLHRGWIDVRSTPGQGAAFHIHLPLTEPPIAAPRLPTTPPQPRGGHETILLVEDESALRSVTRAVLERQGYRVLAAAHGLEALTLSRQPGPTIDLLLTDVVLPEGLGGRELAARLVHERPGLKVVFMSGYIPELAGRRLALEPGQQFVQKPFTSEVLLAAIRGTLGG